MKLVILAGGLGTRLSEETSARPKPMIEIGGRPILWHIMKMYAHHGIKDFVICCGYMGYQITEFFANYSLHQSDVTVDIRTKSIEVHDTRAEDWRVTLVDTGAETMTGGRLKRVRQHIGNETFCMTYGDGVADIDVGTLLAFHARHGLDATVTAVRPPGRFGALLLDEDRVGAFIEKPEGMVGWINGGFFVLSPKVLDRVEGDTTVWEQAPLETLARDKQLAAYRHEGFWQPMDTLRDKRFLEDLWASGDARWKVW